MLILGYPWLKHHNPHIDWGTGKILGWGRECMTTCASQPLSSTTETGTSLADREGGKLIPGLVQSAAVLLGSERGLQ